MEEVQSKCSTCSDRCGKLDVFDWLADLPDSGNVSDIVEVQFKNTRKGYYRNSNGLHLLKGDVVAVEASPGHDIGTVACTGEIAVMQMKKNRLNIKDYEFFRVYRHARPVDFEKWEEAKKLEHETMIESRRISLNLNLNMKIGDVEYQGDKTKAIFYYIADERVDFRQLIKVLADRFKVRIEMRQIGARQEAGRIGGIGPCGRELCCSTWITNFVSVTTNAARYQEISLNPQKLAGQCGKLKCCLNYELDAYIDAQKDFPRTNIPLETKDSTYYHFKTDIFKRLMWYSTDRHMAANLTELSVDRVKEVIRLNRKATKPETLLDKKVNAALKETKALDYENVVGEDSISRFDEPKKQGDNRNRKKRKKKSNTRNTSRNNPRNNPRNKNRDNNAKN
ncbi:Cell fate regulator YaaT, PSP1 superfamily (controls sporulation, competence, biofilm development) [Saccharicrinis carchari]|uniref:Cell fate regulator YaaT, PSP1 superfamily (Controls sporulation, competence, biofilm development) n=1 Tax=Saccharicrinis carchari TaxID=1168039 RepID=A0A521ESU7_SACCC|nr:regulatory iron-sulfur-containing complex subunit RicT [Saccharicrinis carchari]SMO86974.1 Cell fate regulator YaaT, PSP1 superfamily (controls sporulation, competence, biofilm development) [Saccharicrinis carchari]